MDNNEKYVVKVISVFANYIEVEASDENVARALAEQKLAADKENFRPVYEGTLSPDQWLVAKASDLQAVAAEEETVAEQENQEDNKL